MIKKNEVMTVEEFNARAELPENSRMVAPILERVNRALKTINETRERVGLPNENFVVLEVPHCVMSIDTDYQRDININNINNIIANYDPNFVDVKKVSIRDGKIWICDGEHTILAREAIGFTSTLVAINPYLDKKGEARCFGTQHKNAKRINNISLYRADIVAGLEDAVAIDKICKERKLTIKFLPTAKVHTALMRRNINAIKPLREAYKHNKEEGVKVLLDLIIDAGWDEYDSGFKADCLMIGKTLCEIAWYNKTKAFVGDDNYNKVLMDMKAFGNPDAWIGEAHRLYPENRGQHGEASIKNYIKFLCGVIE